MVIKPGIGTFGSVGWCQVLLENEILSAEGNFLVAGCIDLT